MPDSQPGSTRGVAQPFAVAGGQGPQKDPVVHTTRLTESLKRAFR